MTEVAYDDMTALLGAVREGRAEARDELVNRMYRELRRQARAYMRRERRDHTLQPTALVHDALCRLLGADSLGGFENRAHLFGAAACAMHRVLVDHARARSSAKRGGDQPRVPLDAASSAADPAWEGFIEAVDRGEDLFALDEALSELATMSERQHGVFMLHHYAGLTTRAIGEILDISRATVDRDLRIAKAWLRGKLRDDER
jgi:RNA polymerase sigma factor (TIGR02999 family)